MDPVGIVLQKWRTLTHSYRPLVAPLKHRATRPSLPGGGMSAALNQTSIVSTFAKGAADCGTDVSPRPGPLLILIMHQNVRELTLSVRTARDEW